ncbi:MAG: hypothetical protein WAN79_10960 [Opitutaceae bacterium]
MPEREVDDRVSRKQEANNNDRLQNHAIPFVDLTPVAVIERLVDHYESTSGKLRKNEPEIVSTARTVKTLNPAQPPDLLHTRSRGTFGGSHFSNWNDLVRIAHIQAFAKAKTFEALRGVTLAQIREGRFSDSGYHFLPEKEISVQGVDANRAWSYALRLAQYLKTPIKAVVEWRNNEKASNPVRRPW